MIEASQITAVHPQLSPRCVQGRGMCRSKTSGKPILTICPMSRATSSTRSVIITTSLCPRISWACCASCTLMAPSSSKLALLGREHSNWTSWAQSTVALKLRPSPEIKLWDFLCGEWGEVCYHFLLEKTKEIIYFRSHVYHRGSHQDENRADLTPLYPSARDLSGK